MAQCSEIELLLGPFTDGELEPHEMEEVALHVVACRNCKAALVDYRALGVTLRGAIALPELAGFSATVHERVQQFRVPLHIRIKRPFDWFGERMGTAFAMGAAAAVAAVITAVVVTPYAGRLSKSPLRRSRGTLWAPLLPSRMTRRSRMRAMAPTRTTLSARRKPKRQWLRIRRP